MAHISKVREEKGKWTGRIERDDNIYHVEVTRENKSQEYHTAYWRYTIEDVAGGVFLARCSFDLPKGVKRTREKLIEQAAIDFERWYAIERDDSTPKLRNAVIAASVALRPFLDEFQRRDSQEYPEKEYSSGHEFLVSMELKRVEMHLNYALELLGGTPLTGTDDRIASQFAHNKHSTDIRLFMELKAGGGWRAQDCANIEDAHAILQATMRTLGVVRWAVVPIECCDDDITPPLTAMINNARTRS